jgi:hypothetical protein
LTHGEAMGLGRTRSDRSSRIHKAQDRDAYTEQVVSDSGHLLALCSSTGLR